MNGDRATEEFLFKPVGPYCVCKQTLEGFKTITPNVPTKRKAISDAKKFLTQGTFTEVAVLDYSGRKVFSQVKEALDNPLENELLSGFMLLFPAMSLMGAALRGQLAAAFYKEFTFVPNQGDLWSKAEDAALRILWSKVGLRDTRQIALLLGRTDSAVDHRIRRLNLLPHETPRPKIF